MSFWQGKRVLLGVAGGIAAYKAPALVRAFRAEGAAVRVVLTNGGAAFVSELALQVVSEHPVSRELLDATAESEIGHIELARWADVVVVAPATAHLLARARLGLADDLLTTLLLATTAPVVLCPAMNTQMWMHEATQENVSVLRSRRRTLVVEPDAGELACKEVGSGRLPDPPVILAWAERALRPQLLAGRSVVVTAGPTREAFDAARFLSNPSSGKMGFAIAAAAWRAGAETTVIAGPSSQPTPTGVARHDVGTAAELHEAVRARPADVLIMAAAVADWRPVDVAEGKRKKHEGPWTPTLERTTDVLAEVCASEARPACVIGFAAESDDVVARASEKRLRKGADGIVANRIGPGGAFGADDNEVWLVDDRGEAAVPRAPKPEVAAAIVDWIAALLARAEAR